MANPRAPVTGTIYLNALTGSEQVAIASGGGNVTTTTQDIANLANETAGITQLTGDVTAGPGDASQVATLATVNSNVGSFTLADITVNAKGLVTAASSGSAAPLILTSQTTVAAGTGVGTLTNMPVAGNPTVFLQLSVNGTTYVFPGWPV
jgi:hypothetical protein